MLTFSFNFSFSFLFELFFSYGLRIRIKVISQSYCHTSVILDDMVTVMVTSYEVIEKDIEGSKRIMLYNMYNT